MLIIHEPWRTQIHRHRLVGQIDVAAVLTEMLCQPPAGAGEVDERAFPVWSLRLQPGDFIILPSYLLHRVDYDASGMWVVIPTDVFLPD